MQSIQPATPFGRRPASLGLIADSFLRRDALEAARAPGSNAPAAVNKWSLFRAVTAARGPLGLSDRTLTLLNALLSFHPEVALSLPAVAEAGQGDVDPECRDPSCDLVVFPSNRALSARAHGMAEKTMRRHLAALVEAGLIARRDSPNGKRYARRAGGTGGRAGGSTGGREGRTSGEAAEGFADAYGFDITPLVLRAGEIEALAEAERRKALAIRRLSERITILRRDISKCLALALEQGLCGPFEDYRALLLPLLTPLRRIGGDASALDRLAATLTDLRSEVTQALENALRNQNMTGNDGANDRHQSNSNADAHTDIEPSPPEFRAAASAGDPMQPSGDDSPAEAETVPALGLVMAACPDVALYAETGAVPNWRAFRTTLLTIRPMLGISPDAFRDAVEVMGETSALIAVATILQRSEHSSEAQGVARAGEPGGRAALKVNGSPAIRSAGGYLRALTEDARAGRFRLGPLLMALIGQRQKARGRAD